MKKLIEDFIEKSQKYEIRFYLPEKQLVYSPQLRCSDLKIETDLISYNEDTTVFKTIVFNVDKIKYIELISY